MHYFTMSTLAAALLLVPGPSASAQGDNAEQERAIARIEKLGGKFELDDKRPDKPVIKVDLQPDEGHRCRPGDSEGIYSAPKPESR